MPFPRPRQLSRISLDALPCCCVLTQTLLWQAYGHQLHRPRRASYLSNTHSSASSVLRSWQHGVRLQWIGSLALPHLVVNELFNLRLADTGQHSTTVLLVVPLLKAMFGKVFAD